jgi:murein DD-endopeptidase MepM/ murein hydrolase activator NlpD
MEHETMMVAVDEWMGRPANGGGGRGREPQPVFGSIAFAVAVLGAMTGCASAPVAPKSAGESAPSEAAATDARVLEDGRQWTNRFYAGETQALWDQFNPHMQKVIKSKAALDGFRDELKQLGKESKVIEEHVERGAEPVYVRGVQYENVPDRFSVKIRFEPSGKIAGFGVIPEKKSAAPSAYLEYVTHTPLRLPFNGKWTVAWGGRTVEQNRHAVVRNQRFAYDFVIVRNGAEYKESGKANTDYACYGEPVLAPGAGTVAIAVDDVADNTPGVMNRDSLAGNHVVIDHGQKEFSFLAHLQKGSVRVKVGDKIEAGATIGTCGNSGNTSMPHLHYHLQNSPVLDDGDGLPAQFRDYTADGKHVDVGEPVRNQTITNGRP